MESPDGKLEKLRIVPCKEANFSDASYDGADAYDALANPEKYSESFSIEYEDKAPKGAINADLKFKKIKGGGLDLTFIFDSTGVLHSNNKGDIDLKSPVDVESVPDQIQRFKKAVAQYDSETHEPTYVVIYWGKRWELFKGRLSKMKITHSLFKSDGTPIRSKADVSFISSSPQETQDLEKKTNSPDLTHIRVVKEGDTLPLMTHRIYGDSKYFLEIARVNKLTNFRRLKPGTKIVFPPLDKSVA